MDRKEERRNQFARKKKFKKYTRSSKAKTERKKNKRNGQRIFLRHRSTYK